MSAIETFRAERFIFVFNRDLPGHAYEAAVSDDAGSAAIDHPFGMVVLAGSMTVERPDGRVETRRRGFVSPASIPTGLWRFTAGREGCRTVCTHPRDEAAWAKSAVMLAAGARQRRPVRPRLAADRRRPCPRRQRPAPARDADRPDEPGNRVSSGG